MNSRTRSANCRRCARRSRTRRAPLCDIRLTVNDLLAQMVYEGNVERHQRRRQGLHLQFARGCRVAPDVRRHGQGRHRRQHRPDHQRRPRRAAASSRPGRPPFYQTGPNLAREVKANNATLYENLAMEPAPVGMSGVLGKGLMSISVNKATKFPNASIALAQFFTNPRSMVQFAKQVAVYPSSPAAYDDPFFADVPTAVEDSARPIGRGHHLDLPGHRPDNPEEGGRQCHRPQGGRGGAVQQRSRAEGPERCRRRGQQAHRP